MKQDLKRQTEHVMSGACSVIFWWTRNVREVVLDGVWKWTRGWKEEDVKRKGEEGICPYLQHHGSDHARTSRSYTIGSWAPFEGVEP